MSQRIRGCVRTGLTLLAALALLAGCAVPGGSGTAGGGVAPAVPPTAAPTSGMPPSPSAGTSASGSSAGTSASGSSPGGGQNYAGTIQDPSEVKAEASATDARPVKITIPSIDVEAPTEILTTDASGSLRPPMAWEAAGWYDGSPVPGERGPSVIAGHLVDYDGPAVFARLGELGPGDRVQVLLSDGSSAEFTVYRTISAERTDSFPTAEIYGPTPDAQLRLITCDGEYDPARGHWTRNMVVFAAPSQ